MLLKRIVRREKMIDMSIRLTIATETICQEPPDMPGRWGIVNSAALTPIHTFQIIRNLISIQYKHFFENSIAFIQRNLINSAAFPPNKTTSSYFSNRSFMVTTFVKTPPYSLFLSPNVVIKVLWIAIFGDTFFVNISCLLRIVL